MFNSPSSVLGSIGSRRRLLDYFVEFIPADPELRRAHVEKCLASGGAAAASGAGGAASGAGGAASGAGERRKSGAGSGGGASAK